jgi:hypothetical protein
MIVKVVICKEHSSSCLWVVGVDLTGLQYLTEMFVGSNAGYCGGYGQGSSFQGRISISERPIWKFHACFLSIFTTSNSPEF